MPSHCIVPGCDNYRRKREEGIIVSYHRLPTEAERCKEWLRAIKNSKYDENTPTSALGSLRVCSLHFTADDYVRDMQAEILGGTSKKVLKTSAVPCLSGGRTQTSEQTACTSAVSSCGAETQPSPTSATSEGGLHPQQQDTWTVKARSVGQVRSTDAEENVPETLTATTEKPARHHIVDEEAILQLMKNCPMCDRKCRCRKHTHGPYLVVYQSCYFCHYQRKWGSQPEAGNMNACHTAPKRKRKPKKKVSGNAKAPPSSQPNKTDISESSESQEPSKT